MSDFKGNQKMKKLLPVLLAAAFLNGGCAWLNPFSASDDSKETVSFVPNKFLWEAARNKLEFMKIEKENKEAGTIVSDWQAVGDIRNEEFKIEVKVLSSELRSDCLKVVVYKRLWNGSAWVEQPENIRLNQKIEESILEKARVLYREALAINN